MPTTPLTAAETAPAGGAATTELIAMTVALTVLFSALLLIGESYRRAGRGPLAVFAPFSERVSGMPAWAAIPLAVTAVSLVGALFGYMWDVSIHIADGRDEGPLANPSHYFILAGLYGIIAAGYLSTVLPRDGDLPGRSAIRISDRRAIPLGGVLIGAAGLFAFAGFPLDDLWHRAFGQDVTLWGPTHLVMLSGGMLTLVGVAILFEEGIANFRGRPRDAAAEASSNGIRARSLPLLARVADRLPNLPLWPTRALIAGGFLAGLSIYQGEFDHGVPQFELVMQPLMIAIGAGLALVAARVWIGPGAALAAVGFYLVIRGGVALVVGPVLGEIGHGFPLYVPEAIVVELVALALIGRGAPAGASPRRPLIFGAVAGLGAGVLGFAAEWPWINAVMSIGWTEALLPEGPIVAAVAGTAAGVIGALLGLGLRRELPSRPRLAPALAAGSLAAIIACFAFGLADRSSEGSAQITVAEVAPPPEREVVATVRVDPADVAEGASWARGIAWQGGGLVGFDLDEIGPGVFRTPEPLPVHGNWKAAVRFHNGHTMAGVEIFAPEDAGIPAPEVPAVTGTREMRSPDREMLQRERRDDVAPWIWTAASLGVLAMALAFLSVLGWGLGRYARGPRERETRRAPTPSAPAATGAGV
ncbi:MAG: hypothetical protein ACRDKH_00150 [Solirubrobacterales bacterium]